MTALPLVAVDSPQAKRTVTDRLEVLQALIDAPGFDPLLRPDVVQVPPDHPTYGWSCRVPECGRWKMAGKDLCCVHDGEWLAWQKNGGHIGDFLQDAEPLTSVRWLVAPSCRLCPDMPAKGQEGMCYLHTERWIGYRKIRRDKGRQADFQTWLATQKPFSGFGKCQVVACPSVADHPLGLCRQHHHRYLNAGKPGGAAVPPGWTPRDLERGNLAVVTYVHEAAFRTWCMTMRPIARMNQLSLLGLRPLVKAEIKWTMSRYKPQPDAARGWSLAWLQHVADECREQKVNSLADFDPAEGRAHTGHIIKVMLGYLRHVYFTREDTKDAGFIDTELYGVRIRDRGTVVDLSAVTQRWLRDLLWDHLDARLTADPPRSNSTLTRPRRGCVELSAFLEAETPAGGHDPRLLAKDHAVAFVADQRHRKQHGLLSLGLYENGRRHEQRPVTKSTLATTFGGARQVLRAALESGDAERLGLAREFIVTIPLSPAKAGRRRPFPDDVARALANDDNLQHLEESDLDDRGLRDIWEALVFTGRRGSEVSGVRLECISRLNGIPLFWHDQSKVGNYDQAIRIPERLYDRIERRQAKTIARFVQHHGRPPTSQERRGLALFPRRSANLSGQRSVTYAWFGRCFSTWVESLDIGKYVAHQARHTLATNLLRNGANLTHVKRYLGQVSERMAEHYVHLANTDPRLEDALNAVWVAGPGASEPGFLLSNSEPMTREEAEALAIDLTRKSTPAEGGFCTFQPVVDGDACPWNMDCHNCDKFVLSGADLVYWHRKREQWRMLAERAPDGATADYLHQVFEPTARAIDGLEKALSAVGLLDEALALDLRRPQDYFGRVWSTAFRAHELARHEDHGDADVLHDADGVEAS
ncbi:tyrosine-type recombinase/integrase [Streptomyces massasporeus]|uniref:tyrosine-type recombinase/integrase n=1 Tax=Streptomyces massasporeus TaxID=67324 RepID=UPI0033C55CB3